MTKKKKHGYDELLRYMHLLNRPTFGVTAKGSASSFVRPARRYQFCKNLLSDPSASPHPPKRLPNGFSRAGF